MSREWKEGDRFTATGTIKATDRETFLRVQFDGSDTQDLVEPGAMTYIPPDEPPRGSVVLANGKAWTRYTTSWCAHAMPSRQWDEICHGSIIYEATA